MSVLDIKDFNALKSALKQVDEAKKQAKLAKQAGINLDEQLKILEDYEMKIKAILQTYFPGK